MLYLGFQSLQADQPRSERGGKAPAESHSNWKPISFLSPLHSQCSPGIAPENLAPSVGAPFFVPGLNTQERRTRQLKTRCGHLGRLVTGSSRIRLFLSLPVEPKRSHSPLLPVNQGEIPTTAVERAFLILTSLPEAARGA